MIRIDWKFIITLITTITGIMIPVWLSHADLASHSVRIRVISQTALQPDGANAVSGLSISVEGRELKTPYLTVLEISNNGARPIPTSDFESPIEIRATDNTKIVRAQVTATLPKDLQPVVTSSEELLKLQPLLLNPNDSIIAAFVTSGDRPRFTARVRIAGISPIEIEDSESTSKDVRRLWIQGAVAFALAIVYSVGFAGFMARPGFKIRRRTYFLITLSSAFGSGLLLFPLQSKFGFSLWQILLIATAIIVTAMLLGLFINRNPGKPG